MFAATTLYGLANFLPYTMTLTYSAASQPGGGGGGWVYNNGQYIDMPSQSILPGSNMVFALITETTIFGTPVGGEWCTAELHYDFTDVDGGQHRCRYLVGPDRNLYVYSQDLSDGNYVNSTATFYITETTWEQVNCVLTHPAEVTIDAAQDPKAATSVMANLWPQSTNQQFTTTAGPTFLTGPWSRGSAVVVNESSGPVTLTLGAGDTKEETTSIGLELSWSTSLDILGLVNQQVSASITGGEDWTTSVTDSQSYSVTIDPNYQGWLEWAVSSAQITGDFTFTWTPPSGGVTPAGITYHINNATVTQPGRNNDPAVPAVTWRPQVEPNQTNAQRKVIYGGVTVITAGPSPLPSLTGNPSVDIDAATDPDGAAQAMQLWPNATNKNFTATCNPIYTSTQPEVLSSAYQVPPGYPAESTSYTVSQTNSSSWSIGGSVGAETTLSALGFANASVSVTFTASHRWTTSQTNTQTIAIEVEPGYESWITGSQSQATFTGDYTFTAQGTDYTVRNVTVTFPAAADAGPLTAFTYFVVSQKLPPTVAATLTRPGWVAAPPHRPDAAVGSRRSVLGPVPAAGTGALMVLPDRPVRGR